MIRVEDQSRGSEPRINNGVFVAPVSLKLRTVGRRGDSFPASVGQLADSYWLGPRATCSSKPFSVVNVTDKADSIDARSC